MKNSGISWTTHTFNCWWGCLEVSEGCDDCYARSWAERFGFDIWGATAPRRFFGEKHWHEPIKWNKEAQKAGERARVFCASMADWAETHRDHEIQAKLDAARMQLAALIVATPWLDWLLLTKRIENAPKYLKMMFGDSPLPDNLWIGCTAENQKYWDKRIPILATIPAVVRFVSVEPQIGPVSILDYPRAVDWLIVGGESGAKCRPFELSWARQLRDECAENGVAFFLKQLGGHPNKRHEMSDFPEDLRVQEFPVSQALP